MELHTDDGILSQYFLPSREIKQVIIFVEYLPLIEIARSRLPQQIVPNLDDLISKVEMAVHDLEKTGEEPANDLLIHGIKSDEQCSFVQIEYLDSSLVIVLTRLLLVQGDQHHRFLVKRIRLDSTVRVLILLEEVVRLEVTEHHLHALQAERVVLFHFVLSEDELVLAQILQFLRASFA